MKRNILKIEYNKTHIQIPKKRITKEILKLIFKSLEKEIHSQDSKKGLKKGVGSRLDGLKPSPKRK